MKKYSIHLAILVACLSFAGCATTHPTADLRGDATTAYGVGGKAQLFDNMGDYTQPITTNSPRAQKYFDQGMAWLFGFNHDEAVRSFTHAAELDPNCAMAWWGVAYAQGPNYNSSKMNEARQVAAWQATQKALAALDNETPTEQALIRALQVRYQDPTTEKKLPQKKLIANYAQALAKIWADNPQNPDVGTLYAESLMLKNPWRLHKADGSPRGEETLTIIATLETVFELNPAHPGANHYYIHTVEASSDKQRAIPAADRLSTLVPMSGHTTHMPSHLYVQVGMWDRAVQQNVLAMASDKAYLARSPNQYRQHGYIAHNGHMLAFAGMMIGREEEAMAGARAVWDMPDPIFQTIGKRYDRAMCAVYEVQRRFGRWDELIAEPAPPEILTKTTAAWRACRATAFAAKKDFDNAAKEQAAFRELLAKQPKDKYLLLNEHFIAGEIALQQEDWDEAIAQLNEAIKHEERMGYGEPPRWTQPVRHTLGAVYLKANQPADAERVYREDLDQWPGNGWSLYGLARALESQGKTKEAAAAYAQFDRAWANADKPLRTSCKCIPAI